ncbi:hypothetical protein LTR78_009914 [Recurvomyces mirabilis]|uniref:Enoyl reductase (ER) domain-containing protein n=1 Tax=Recurvomyces mirabilis TaxID=574656 RepID=A0AAE0TRD6_9PEZI|nr:hypothetical protein LTR78_009914 [Recurvomyces mirabilis]KAK5160346.1 hypothetical protein LTS14_001358 [Recurvomyces mirabilis]
MACKSWHVASPGTLTLKEHDKVPTPGPKEVLVRIKAAGFNYRDVLVVNHDPAYPLTPEPDLVPCSDGAGTVEAVGSEVSRWKEGDNVIVFASKWYNGPDLHGFKMEDVAGSGYEQGTLTQYMVRDEERLFRAPEHLSMEEASTLFTAGVTTYRALFHGPKLVGKGMTVLTQGTGGVSCYAIQLAAAAGATVIATSSSDGKLDIARKLGATHVVNYRNTPNWSERVLELTGGKGVDLTVDVVGAESIEQTLKSTSFGGVVVVVGLLSQEPNFKVDIMTDILYGSKTMVGQLGAGSRDMAEGLVDFMEKHDLKPEIAKTFKFEEAVEGLQAASKLTAPGKVVIKV